MKHERADVVSDIYTPLPIPMRETIDGGRPVWTMGYPWAMCLRNGGTSEACFQETLAASNIADAALLSNYSLKNSRMLDGEITAATLTFPASVGGSNLTLDVECDSERTVDGQPGCEVQAVTNQIEVVIWMSALGSWPGEISWKYQCVRDGVPPTPDSILSQYGGYNGVRGMTPFSRTRPTSTPSSRATRTPPARATS